MSDHNNDAVDELDDLLSIGEPDDDEISGIPTDEKFVIHTGKYKGLVMRRLIGVKPSFYAQVMVLKEGIKEDPDFQRRADTIALTYAALRRETEAKSKELSALKLKLAAAMLLMIEQYEVEGTSGLTLRNGDKVRWQPEPHLVVLDKEVFRQWCLKQGLERDMTLQWAKANKMAKQMKVDGIAEPPGTECFMRPKVFWTRGDK